MFTKAHKYSNHFPWFLPHWYYILLCIQLLLYYGGYSCFDPTNLDSSSTKLVFGRYL